MTKGLSQTLAWLALVACVGMNVHAESQESSAIGAGRPFHLTAQGKTAPATGAKKQLQVEAGADSIPEAPEISGLREIPAPGVPPSADSPAEDNTVYEENLSAGGRRPSIDGISDRSIQQNDEIVKSNDFVTGRGLGRYDFYFGKKLKLILKNLGKGGAWIDSGAGKANAQRDYVNFLKKQGVPGDQYPALYAISYRFPSNTKRVPNIQYIEGQYVEDIDFFGKHSVDVITDVLGPISYSTRVDDVLNRYLLWLKPGGKIFIKSLVAG